MDRSRIDKIVKVAEPEARKVYESTECATGCCGDFAGAIRIAVEVALKEAGA